MHLLLLGLDFTSVLLCIRILMQQKSEVSLSCEIFYSILKSLLLKGMF